MYKYIKTSIQITSVLFLTTVIAVVSLVNVNALGDAEAVCQDHVGLSDYAQYQQCVDNYNAKFTELGCGGIDVPNEYQSCIAQIENELFPDPVLYGCPTGTTYVFSGGEPGCQDSFGNTCSKDQLVEGISPGTLRCPTVGSGATFSGTGFEEPDAVSTNADCGGVGVAIDVGCEGSEPIPAYLNAIVNFLAGGVGLVVIIMVAMGGVQYMTAGGNPQATQAALKRIINAIIGLLFFIFLYAFLQWLIPGGTLFS